MNSRGSSYGWRPVVPLKIPEDADACLRRTAARPCRGCSGAGVTTLPTLTTRPSVPLAALLFSTYAYFYQAGGWNQNSRFDLVRAVVEDHSLQIDRFEGNTGDDSVRDGHWYCDKAPGASALCMPTYAAIYHTAGAPPAPSPALLAWSAWVAILLAIGAPSAIAAAFLVRLGRLVGLRERTAIVVALGWGLGSMALPYATLLYGNQLAAVLTIVAFTWLVELRDRRPASPSRMLAVGALLGLAGATEYPAMLLVAGIGLYSLHTAGIRSSLWAVAGAAIPLAALLLYHRVAFGSLIAFPYEYSVWDEPKTGWFMGISAPKLTSLRNILWGEYRGLLFATPWLALALPGACVLMPQRRAEVLVCTWAISALLWLNASIIPWHGGWAPGPRYLVPMLPFAALLAGGALQMIGEWCASVARPTRILGMVAAAAIAGTLAFSIANMFVATAVKPEIDQRWERPYRDFVWPHFLAGELSISTQSIDMLTGRDGAPHQAWNLGIKMGLSGHWSLAPLAVVVLGCATWLASTLGLIRGRAT